jgi:hypothetical protein
MRAFGNRLFSKHPAGRFSDHGWSQGISAATLQPDFDPHAQVGLPDSPGRLLISS